MADQWEYAEIRLKFDQESGEWARSVRYHLPAGEGKQDHEVTLAVSPLDGLLAEMGLDGWELMDRSATSTEAYDSGSHVLGWMLTFKRRRAA